MGKINGRNKGANGEREAALWLKAKFKLEHLPQRNLEQYRYGAHVKSTGFDLTGFPPFCWEVKRCETVSLRSWWSQAVHAADDTHPHPVVMYRQNRQPWRFLISARNIGCRNGFIQLEEREFIQWANRVVNIDQEGD